ncbi:MAG: acetate--CoA ligase family protein [Sulfolobales archaeon]
MTSRDLDFMFKPRSVAIVGASGREGSLGRGLTENVINSFSGEIFLVNKRGGDILGRKAFKSVREISRPLDLALVIVPAEYVPEVLEDLRSVNGKIAVIYSGGFREAGREDLEREIIRIARLGGVRVLGPNCVGFIDNWTPINATFISTKRQGIPKRGYISIISQSGALGSLFLDLMSYRGLGLSKFVSVGNASDIEISEVLEYLSNDELTRVIGLYIESIVEGRRLLESLRAVSTRKPVVILRGGRTPRGMRAALSHVGALSSSPKLVDGVLGVSGVLIERDLRGFIASLEALDKLSRGVEVRNIIVITNTGGLGVLTADALESEGFELLDLDERSIKILRSVIPSYMSVNNPIDLSGDSPTSRYKIVIDTVLRELNPGFLIIINQPQTYAMDTDNFLKLVSELRSLNRSFIVLVSGGFFAREFALRLREEGVVVAEDPVELVSMLRALRVKPSVSESIYTMIDERRGRVKDIIERAYREGRKRLLEHESKRLLREYGIEIPRGFVIRDEGELNEVASKLGFPLVLKIVSREVIHKSDIGGVILNIANTDDLRDRYRSLVLSMTEKNIRIDGVLVEEMIFSPIELILGGFRDNLFGPIITFGSGGVFVELLRDISFRPFDATREEVLQMIQETKVSEVIFKGYRGVKNLNPDVIIDALARISRILYDNPEIKEIEINPAGVKNNKLVALDARVVLE